MQRLKVSDNGRFLVEEDGTPFFWLGDTAWLLIHTLEPEEVDTYLEDRAAKGFNVIQTVIGPPACELHNAEHSGVAYQEKRFIDKDPTRPDESYFKRVDHVVDKAEEEGLYVCLIAAWGWAVVRPNYRFFDENNMRIYGEYVGSRYRYRSNIVWCIGGDHKAVIDEENAREHEKNWTGDYRPVWRALAEGIARGITVESSGARSSGLNPVRSPKWNEPHPAWDRLLMTWHPPGRHSSSKWFHRDVWLDLNMIQTGHSTRDNPFSYSQITHDYSLEPAKPVLDGESPYEDHHVNWKPDAGFFDDWDIRKAAYWSVFAGACGHTYGNHNIWYFNKPGREPWVRAPQKEYWYNALDYPGACQMIHLRHLMESRPYLIRVPDQSIVLREEGQENRPILATRASDSSYAFVYVPDSPRAFEVDMQKISGNAVKAWWYDSRTVTAERIGDFSDHGSRVFHTPPEGPDWVLVLDDAQRKFPKP